MCIRDRSIAGSLLCSAEITDTLSRLELDLDTPFAVDSVHFKKGTGSFYPASYSRTSVKLFVIFPEPVIVGNIVSVKVFYHGVPRVASNPPWGCGFVWRTTPSGKPWLGVTVEDEGADYWWPCKDHPSDEPDSMRLSFTVPNPLQCISNGKFLGSVDNGNNTSTYNWFISTPINNYNVTFYAAEFSLIEDMYYSTSGDSIPFYFWVLPERYTTAVNYMSVFLNEFNFLEQICGPFPFGVDKHGWAHAPYYGMEHQTIVAYGNNFSVNSWGYDYIHLHELAHEWWGNLVTAKDWADVWIHEGIATYTEALYIEHIQGISRYHQYMSSIRPSNGASYPLAPRDTMTASQAFNYLNPYYRGASVMHTLRYHLGDNAFFNLLKRWAYPDSNSTGIPCRIMSTDDIKNHAEEVTGLDLDPFFEVFFREALYPVLKVYRENDNAAFVWTTQNNVPLDLDIPILVNGSPVTVAMTNGTGTAAIAMNDNLVIDPQKWILMGTPVILIVPVEMTSFTLSQSGNIIELKWSTGTETNNRGFEIERKSGENEWNTIGFVKGSGTSAAPKDYSFRDKLSGNGNYSYRLKQIDFDGAFEYSKVINIDFKYTPEKFALEQNYPNPFNPVTSINYSLPSSGNVKVEIFNMLGESVDILVDAFREPGYYEVQWNAGNCTSGIYLYKIEVTSAEGENAFKAVRKMIIVK